MLREDGNGSTTFQSGGIDVTQGEEIKSNFLFLSTLNRIFKRGHEVLTEAQRERGVAKKVTSNKTYKGHFITDCMMKYLSIILS